MTEALRRVHVYKRAYALAASGQHAGYATIERALVDEGYPEAGECLSRPDLRAQLTDICRRALARKTEPRLA